MMQFISAEKAYLFLLFTTSHLFDNNKKKSFERRKVIIDCYEIIFVTCNDYQKKKLQLLPLILFSIKNKAL